MGQERFNILKVPKRACRTCEYEWYLRAEIERKDGKTGKKKGAIIKVELAEPKNCPNPKCKSPYWNRPYTLGVRN